jgi:RHS repeat-associated protein
MSRKFRTVNYEESINQTVRLAEVLPASHLAWFVVNVIAELDLGRIYKLYGGVLSSVGGGATNYGFTNEWTDTSTGDVYLRARWYAPGQGRFLTKDTWEGDYMMPMSYNAWDYGSANPIRFTDPSGYWPLTKVDRDPVDHKYGGIWYTANYWTSQDENAIEDSAREVGKALARTINNDIGLLAKVKGIDLDDIVDDCRSDSTFLQPISDSLAFLLVYKGPVTFMQIAQPGYGAYGETKNRNLVNVFVDYRSGWAVTHTGWAIHELGHAFEHAVSPSNVYNSIAHQGLIGEYLLRKGDPKTDPYAGFRQPEGQWQFHPTSTEAKEIFADMFLGWVRDDEYNSGWAVYGGKITPMGKLRKDFMNKKMPVAIGLALDQR